MQPGMPPVDPEFEGKMISVENIQRNFKELDRARGFFAIIAGILAGVMYCTGVHGLVAYIAMSLLINGALLLKMNLDSKGFTSKSFVSFVVADMSKNAMSFILFWTLTYALIYIY
jgi:ER membrane protein complex subunit 6